MRERTLKRILGGLGILVVAWLISTQFSGWSGGGGVPDAGVASLLEGLNETTVSSVRMVGPDQTVSLERSDGAWTVNGYAADSTAVIRLWRALDGAVVGGVVANNPKNHARLGLSPDSAWAVDFTLAEGRIASLLVGDRGPIGPSGYMRLPEQDAVVVVSGDLRPALTRSLTDWRDKTILRLDTAAVVRVVWEMDAETHVAERSDTTWSVDGVPANLTPMRSVLGQLANLVALGFVEDGEVFQENGRRVIAFGADGDTLGAVVLTGEGGTRHGRTPGSDVVFEVASFRADLIAPDMATLRAADPGDG